MTTPTILRHVHLPGLTLFANVQALQNALVTQFLAHKALVSSQNPPSPLPPPPVPTILTFVTRPVYTTGRREKDSLSPTQLRNLRKIFIPQQPSGYNKQRENPQFADVESTLRGGQITFHGPGQLVIYPILDLRTAFPEWKNGLSVKCYVHLLEQTTINTLANWRLNGVRTENPGVWEEGGEKKIAALGVHLRRNITSYGVGLNINTDLGWFDRIVACGLEGKGVTSMLELGKKNGLWKLGQPGKYARRAWMQRILRQDPDGTKNKIEMGEDGRWHTKTKTTEQLRASLKPGRVARRWVNEIAKALYGLNGEELISNVRVKDLRDVDDEVIGSIIKSATRKPVPQEEEELRQLMAS